jgi:hypothetical protein
MKILARVFFLSIIFFVTSAQATMTIYNMDTNGAEDSPKSIMDSPAQNQVNITSENVDYLSVKPSGTLWALVGKQVLGKGQGMLPFGGDGVRSLFYGVFAASASEKDANGYSGSVGGGYRRIVNNSYILGAYALADFNRSPTRHNFWVGGVGIEVLNYNWDFRVNGYVPVGRKYWSGLTGENDEETSTGIDVEVGRIIPLPKTKGLKLFVGGYHYFMNRNDEITGIEMRIVYPLTSLITIELRNSYDDARKNIAMGGLRLTLGGFKNELKENLGIARRMSDPIERNFANFASCNTSVVRNKYPN